MIAEAQGEYNRSTMPYFLIEAAYEDETASPTETRQQAWQAVLSGATGQVTGQESIWPFVPGVWTSQLNTEGASTLIHLRTLLESYSWWTLVPDFANAFLTGGVGTAAARAPAARAADGSFAIIYTRDIRDLTVNIGSLAGPGCRRAGTTRPAAASPPCPGRRLRRPAAGCSVPRGRTPAARATGCWCWTPSRRSATVVTRGLAPAYSTGTVRCLRAGMWSSRE